MGLAKLLEAHYTNQIRGKNLKQIVVPQAVGAGNCIGETIEVGGALTYGAWVDITNAAIADIGTDTLVVGVVVDTPTVSSAADIWTIDIGCTLSVDAAGLVFNYADAAAVIAGLGPAIAAAHRAEIRMELASDSGIYQPVMLEYPVLIPSGVGILARGYDVADASAGAEPHDQLNVSVLLVQNFKGRIA